MPGSWPTMPLNSSIRVKGCLMGVVIMVSPCKEHRVLRSRRAFIAGRGKRQDRRQADQGVPRHRAALESHDSFAFPHMWGWPHWGVCALLYAKNFHVRRRFHIDLIDLIIIIPTEIAIVISWGGLFIRSRNGEAFDSRPLISFKSINNWSAVRFFAPHLGGGPTGKKFARKKC